MFMLNILFLLNITNKLGSVVELMIKLII